MAKNYAEVVVREHRKDEIIESVLKSKSQDNKDALLVMGANLETGRQEANTASPYIFTGQQVAELFKLQSKTTAKGRKPLPLNRLMREVGLSPHNPSWMSIVSERLRLSSMGDSGITAKALERMSFESSPDLSVLESVQQLIDEVNRDFRDVLSGRTVDAFQRAEFLRGGTYFSMHPYARHLGINIARGILR